MKNIHNFLTSLFMYSHYVKEDFSVNDFLRQNAGLICSVASGVSDEKFPLLQDYHGRMLFCFYRVKETIEDPKFFFEKAVEDGFILPGFKGICVLWYKWRDAEIRGDKENPLPKGWILSPNKVPSKLLNERVSVPYLDTIITGEMPHKKYGNIHYSSWCCDYIPEGRTILLLKKID